MKRHIPTIRIFALGLALACAAGFASADKKPQQQVKPMAGPRATALRVTWLYITPSTSAQKVDKVQIGREMVVAEKSGTWMRVYANTDIEEQHSDKDEPMVGGDETTPPISGWIEGKGIVEETTPGGDAILMGAAANQEAAASDPRGAANAAQSARLLYRRIVEMFPNSPLVPDAMWRAADIEWQVQRADAATLPSAHERDPVYRQQMDEDALRKVIRYYPKSKWAALAAYDLIDNKLCGDWQGAEQCPAKESEYYIKYADEYPDGPRTPRALYEAVYRLAVLTDMYAADRDDRRSGDARNQARTVAAQLKAHFPDSDYAYRAGALVYKLDEGVPVYGIDRE
jgi:outer membrane protein assembly factor BamD (BamD/ComL family)